MGSAGRPRVGHSWPRGTTGGSAHWMSSLDEAGCAAGVNLQESGGPILSDPTKEVATAYGVVHPERGFAMRWTFYIGKDGKIAAVDKAVKPPTSAEDVIAQLETLKVPKAH